MFSFLYFFLFLGEMLVGEGMGVDWFAFGMDRGDGYLALATPAGCLVTPVGWRASEPRL